MLKNILLVAAGGSIGAVSRYLISVWASQKIGQSFPYGTLIANVAGCFMIGAFMAIAVERLGISAQWRLFFTVGFVGGLTTFSSFSYETFKLVDEAGFHMAMANILANMAAGFFATWAGISLGRLVPF